MLTHVAYHFNSSVQRVIDHSVTDVKCALQLRSKKRGVRDDTRYT